MWTIPLVKDTSYTVKKVPVPFPPPSWDVKIFLAGSIVSLICSLEFNWPSPEFSWNPYKLVCIPVHRQEFSWIFSFSQQKFFPIYLKTYWCTCSQPEVFPDIPLPQSGILTRDCEVIISELLGSRARICRPDPRNRFPAWRAGTTTLFVVPARQAIHRLAESIPRNRFLGSINFYKYGLRTSESVETDRTFVSESLHTKIPRKSVVKGAQAWDIRLQGLYAIQACMGGLRNYNKKSKLCLQIHILYFLAY